MTSPTEKTISSKSNFSNSSNNFGIFPASFFAGTITVFVYTLFDGVSLFLNTIYLISPRLNLLRIVSNKKFKNENNPNT